MIKANYVNLASIEKICIALDFRLEDVVEIINLNQVEGNILG
nr:hypothetical protein [Gemella sp. zg-1178]